MEWSDAWSIILFILGYLFLALIALRLLASLYRIVAPYLLCPRRNLHARAGARWAVITGATDGIGKAYAFELAEQKFDIFLVSRTASKLVTTKTEILEKFPGVKVEMCAFDFTVPTFEDYQPLLNELASIDVGILVNNVGMAIDCPEKLYEVEGGGEALARISTCNTLPVIILSSAVLEQMVKRKAGVIINISSMAALNEMAYWNVYSAGKKFMLHLSNILRQEYSVHGITVQCVTPGGVSTKLKIVDGAEFFEPSATKFVKSALRTVGIVDNTTGYFAHQIMSEMVGLMPHCLSNRLFAIFNRKLRESIHAKRNQ
uniref:Dehydrogenase n=1 Tax=Pristionchus pacificus TaxID=54126 RepID=A0A8R1UFG1_PRIPA